MLRDMKMQRAEQTYKKRMPNGKFLIIDFKSKQCKKILKSFDTNEDLVKLCWNSMACKDLLHQTLFSYKKGDFNYKSVRPSDLSNEEKAVMLLRYSFSIDM